MGISRFSPILEGGYVAFNPETSTTTQGETVKEALANLREATELYLEEFPLIVSGRPLLTMLEAPENKLLKQHQTCV
ncbi:type II toxin-antitoxin system HicB family antitoxin [Nitrosomonas communis]|uniref:Predicted nuclease of the RNAse H fold, HicB family n=1 Tax=Nitrosomonas communis TaxID=44574 RepID=A0A1H2URZ4_9PROT|nr:type II toxin-antitoxin system HicB family antitoxin [Nitrosomonas communis]SDW58855.1 Predicted nuclease of the RNAse H fold, HicB family [Nitrosomonas communis]